MTVATLLLTCLIFLALGWTDRSHRFMALSVAAIVCVAASNGGTTSQDLKTGYLVGATPIYQQWAILDRPISSALVIGCILIAAEPAPAPSTPPRACRPLEKPLDVASARRTRAGPRRRHAVLRVAGDGGKSRARRRRASIWSTHAGRSATWSIRASTAPSTTATTAPKSRNSRPPRPADGPDHRRHPHAEASLDAGAAGRGHRHRAGIERRAVAAVCGGRLSAAVVIHADLRGRPGSLRGRAADPARRAKPPAARPSRT